MSRRADYPVPHGQLYYAIYPHAEKGVATGRGFVVRQCDAGGVAFDNCNYGGVLPLITAGKMTYRRITAAEKAARERNA